MSDYYFKHKAELNYRKKLLYNIRKYPFIKSEDDAEYWITMRKYFSPFKKVLSKTKDIGKMMDFLHEYLKYVEGEGEEEKNSNFE